jgi:hypothetical protein
MRSLASEPGLKAMIGIWLASCVVAVAYLFMP